MTPQSLHKTHALKALQRLSILAAQSGNVVELALCYGAVIMVAYRAERGQRGEIRTNDVAVYLADAVREELRLRLDWIETDIARYISDGAANRTIPDAELAPGLIVSVNGAARVIAQKLHLLTGIPPPAATDVRDAEFLLSKISVSNPGRIK